ncbi:MAG: hypothetical protein IPK77_02995 [Cellvibrio sp.]|nr:hypothetical protein [Cellvibrio sp.]
MLKWLMDNPTEDIPTEIERILNQQISGSKLISFHVTSAPDWLTGGIKAEKDANKVILVRTAVAFEFELSVKTPETKIHHLSGVFTWAGVNLHQTENRQFKTWFDLDSDLSSLGKDSELKNRIYFA